MSQRFGYLVDLTGVSLDESTTTSWIRAMPNGEYTHPVYGNIKFDDERAKQFADNVTNNVRGIELDIDYDHKAKTDKAAGWVKKAEVRAGNGLWLLVEWTKEAFKALKEKEYKYFSPEFYDEWEHPETKVVHKNVLFGGGITNRPFLKNILPINLSETLEAANAAPPKKEGSTGMAFSEEQLKQLRTKYKLAEDASEEDVIKATLEAPLADPEKKPEETKLSELETQLAEVKKLAESNDTMKPVVALMEQQAEALKKLQETNEQNQVVMRLSETNTLVDALAKKCSDAGFALSPVDKSELIRQLSEDKSGVKLSESPVYKLMDTVISAKLTQLGEIGKLRVVKNLAEDEVGKPAGEVLTARANKLLSEKKATDFGTAMRQVCNEDPDLYNEYRGVAVGGAK